MPPRPRPVRGANLRYRRAGGVGNSVRGETREKLSRAESGERVNFNSAARERARGRAAAFRPQKKKMRVRIKISDLENPETGAKIPSENVEMFRVGYVPISRPTDALGERGDWPDPLFRMESGEFEAAGNSTQPVWLRFFVPPGRSKREPTEGSSKFPPEVNRGKIPVSLRVYGFRLPRYPRRPLGCRGV